MISIEEKIQRIEQTTSLNEVSLECLPPVQTEKYYFVSYSHKDYKLVYKDIFYLQQQGFSIWYDRGMEAGKNWKETAEKYITKYNCAGVIFYLSENSILSEAIHEEIKLLLENGKEFVTINLPFEGSYMSAKEIMNKLIERGISISPEKQEFIEKHLNEDIIYIRTDASLEEKIEKINSLKSSPLFKISELDPFDTIEYYIKEKGRKNVCLIHEENNYFLETTGMNDLDVKEITIKDFYNSIKEPFEVNHFVQIGDSTFSNCRKLEQITLPKNISIIKNYAFYNCQKLEKIDLSNIVMIGEHSFENCLSLKRADLTSLGKLSTIDNYVFNDCINLKKVILPNTINKIGYCAFQNTKITQISTSVLLGEGILPYAFNNCKQLESFVIDILGEFEIDHHAFYECSNLKEFIVKNGKIVVKENAFEECINLTSFPFNLVEEIGERAFYNCKSLKELVIKAINIPNSAFESCVNITNIVFKEKADYSISDSAFEGLKSLKTIVFAPKLKWVGNFAFKNCINLESIYLPKNIIYIDKGAFYNCKNLKEIYFGGTSAEWKILMNQHFNYPWFEETGEYAVTCSDKTISKYEFKRE